MKKLSVITVTIMLILLLVVPLSIHAEEEYDEHDTAKLRCFLEQTDPNGVKNGEKLNPDYNPDEPSTWTGTHYNEWEGLFEGVNWDQNGRVRAFYADEFFYSGEYFLCGDLDFSGMTALEQSIITGCSIEREDYSGCLSLSKIENVMSGTKEIVIDHLPALTFLALSYNEIRALDLSGCLSLETLLIEDNDLSVLDVSGCPELFMLMCGNNELSSIDVSKNTNLEELHCDNNRLTSLDVSSCTELKNLQFNNNMVSEIDLDEITGLWALGCAGNGISELNVRGCPDLWYLQCENNEIKELDLANNSCLTDLYCYNNKLDELILAEDCVLTNLFVENNRLKDIDYSRINSFGSFDGSDNLFETLDIDNDLGGLRFCNNPTKSIALNINSINLQISVIGTGTVDLYSGYEDGWVFTEPFLSEYYPCGNISKIVLVASTELEDGFLGWYDEYGELVSTERELVAEEGNHWLQARFVEQAEPTPVASEAPIEPLPSEAPTEPAPSAFPTETPTDPPAPPVTGGKSILVYAGLLVAVGSCIPIIVYRKKQ